MRKYLGIGINDSDTPVYKFKKEGKKVICLWTCPFYVKWTSMLKRCYSQKVIARQPTYAGCSVCDEWLYFSKFKTWMSCYDWEGKELDKDILFVGNKIYSPETCCFVAKSLNRFTTDRASKRGEFKIGVCFYKRYGNLNAHIQNPFTGRSENLGYFDNENEAHEAWRKRKHELACQLADLQTNERVAAALRVRYAS